MKNKSAFLKIDDFTADKQEKETRNEEIEVVFNYFSIMFSFLCIFVFYIFLCGMS